MLQIQERKSAETVGRDSSASITSANVIASLEEESSVYGEA